MTRTHMLPAARALAFLRIATGAGLLFAAWGKLTMYKVGGALPMPVVALHWQIELPERLTTWLASHPTGIWAAIVRDLLLPHGALVAGLIAWSQVIAGVMLLVGLRTRLAATLAILVSVALALAAGWRDAGDVRPYLMQIMLCIALLIGGAGDTLGLDGWRRERRRDRDL
ncbi:MAG: TQO small subunit DoxD [Gemmatimonadales bacterium]